MQIVQKTRDRQVHSWFRLGHARRCATTGPDGPDSSVWRCRRCSSRGFGRPCDHAETVFSGTVEVPQIQLIAWFGGHPSSQQRQVSQLGAMKGAFLPF